jgi:8-oxo-dGTP diphosphatase
MKQSTICFLVKDGKMYLSEKKSGFGAGYLNGYGGKVDEGESVVEAALRELEEEAGVKASPEHLDERAVIEFYEVDRPVFECHIFFVDQWEGEFHDAEKMALPEPFPIDNLPWERMLQGDKFWLERISAGERLKGRVIYKEGMKEVSEYNFEPLNSELNKRLR